MTIVCPGAASLVDGDGGEGDPTSGVAAEVSSAIGDAGRGDVVGEAGPGDAGVPGDAVGDPAMADAVG